MNPLTREWVQKAEGDFATACREVRVRKAPNYDAVCFHAQQCAEKYLKAALQEASTPFGKTHNLIALLEALKKVDSFWESIREPLQTLSGFAVVVRYPGELADKDTAREALTLCSTVRSVARNKLGLKPS